MAYSFAGFFGPKEPIELLSYQFPGTKLVALGQGLFLVPLIESLAGRMNRNSTAQLVDGFWDGGERIKTIRFGATAFDALLRHLGVMKSEGLTESETLGFHLRRFTEDWLGGIE
ncbi:MAG: hypothetical protein EOO15_05430 [Chitinophagaceae bacterium]|nr:MAG: hypothetical protein EOO15_05430 [Chitinophagaceae bacterium]